MSAMYLEYFGLQEAPFSVAPNPRFLFMSPQHEEALAHLVYGLGQGGGFVLLTGEVGTGKTTLCRHLLEHLPQDVDVALIFNPRLNAVELLSAICDELKAPYRKESQSLKVLVDALNEHLLASNASGRRTVLIIDEAQNLSLDVLEQIRLLTNLETDRAKLLQVILIGQPELRRMLEAEELRQLTQRITARYHLAHLSAEDTKAYILHRLSLSGGQSRLFTLGALRMIHRMSGGIPRVINTLCDRALLGAFTSNRYQVDRGIVRKATREVLSSQASPAYGRYALVAFAAALLGGLATSAYRVSENSQWKAMQGRENPTAVAAAPVRPTEVAPPHSKRTPPLKIPIAEHQQPRTTTPPFTEVLNDTRHSLEAAFRILFAVWGHSGTETAQGNCEGARTLGLHCLLQNGTWQQMRKINLPVILEFVLDNGERRYLALVGDEGETATLSIAGEQQQFSLAQTLPFWQGHYAVLWKPPDPKLSTLTPGSRNAAVRWLRQQLGSEVRRSGDASYFDEDLKARVLEFQRERGLKTDGIVGPRTMVHLLAARPTADTPRLIPKE